MYLWIAVVAAFFSKIFSILSINTEDKTKKDVFMLISAFLFSVVVFAALSII